MGSNLKAWDHKEWTETTWGDIVELKYGKALRDYKESKGEYPVYGTNGPVGFYDKPLCNFPSIVVGRKGAYRGIHYSNKPFYVIDTAFYISPYYDINLKWAYYNLLLQDINGLDSGSAIPSTRREDFYALPVKIPPRTVQDFICMHLDSLNDKIALNRQINQTLEQMAQALFKSWFVDFDPVIDNALDAGNTIPEPLQTRAELRQAVRKKDDFKPLPDDIRNSFPNEFEESELGWIPKGWEVSNISAITDILSGYAFKSKDFSDDGDAVIKIKNINSDRTIDISDTQRIPKGISKNSSRFKLCDGSLLMAMTGATVGKFGLLVSENNEPYFLNQRVAKFEPKHDSRLGFLYCILNQENSIDYVMNTAQGSAQPNISAKDILSMPMTIPNISLIKYFNEKTESAYFKLISNRKEIFTLTKLRDTLLPKLISGELSLADVELD